MINLSESELRPHNLQSLPLSQEIVPSRTHHTNRKTYGTFCGVCIEHAGGTPPGESGAFVYSHQQLSGGFPAVRSHGLPRTLTGRFYLFYIHVRTQSAPREKVPKKKNPALLSSHHSVVHVGNVNAPLCGNAASNVHAFGKFGGFPCLFVAVTPTSGFQVLAATYLFLPIQGNIEEFCFFSHRGDLTANRPAFVSSA